MSVTSTRSIPVGDDPQLDRIRDEFAAMPGLRLTLPQARRLWGLEEASCSRLLHRLVELRYLARTRDGVFIRSESDSSPRRAARRSAARA